MAERSRYSVKDDVIGGVLENKLGITDQNVLVDTETILLSDTYTHFFGLLEKGKISFDLPLFFSIHRYFLDTLYSWAGKVRTVQISKDGILFAPVEHIEAALENFERILGENIPSIDDTKRIVVKKIAFIHNEFNAIHPFREGNGRTVRLFLDLLVVRCGYMMIDYSLVTRERYFFACAAGVRGDHLPMERIMLRCLHRRK